MSGRTFAEALREFNLDITINAAVRPFNLFVESEQGSILVTRKEVGGPYVAYIDGREFPAVSDGGRGVGVDGVFHFSLEDNPLG